MNRLSAIFVTGLIFLNLSSSVLSKELRWKIKHVHFSGNKSYKEERLHRLMVCRPSSFLNRRNYHPQILNDDLKNIELFYHQNGYLDAKIKNYIAVYDTGNASVQIRILLDEGKQTMIESVSILGNTSFPDSLLQQVLELKFPSIFSRKKIESSSLKILTFYANHGYLDTKIDHKTHIDTTRYQAVIDYILDEGNVSSIQNIEIIGLEKTRRFIVYRELSFKVNEIVKYEKLLDSQKKLYLTGLFTSVYIHPIPIDSNEFGNCSILIELKEKESIVLNLSGGYGSLDKLRCRVEILNQNLRGQSQRLGCAGHLSSIKRSIESAFTEPWTFGTRWQTDVRLRAEHRKEPSYNLNQYGGFLTFGYRFKSKLQFMIMYRRDFSSLSDVKTSEFPEDPETNLNSIKFTILNDSRNNLFNPSRGVYLEWSHELGHLFSTSSRNYYRTVFVGKGFYSFHPSTIIGSGIEIGWITTSGGLPRIPLHERFFTGGPNSIRGFRYQRLGPKDLNGNPYGGQFKISMNLIEIRRTIHRSFGVAVFIDGGNVWGKTENFRFSEILMSPGAGIRMNTVIGTARFDVAFNPFAKNNEPKSLYMFNMGHAF